MPEHSADRPYIDIWKKHRINCLFSGCRIHSLCSVGRRSKNARHQRPSAHRCYEPNEAKCPTRTEWMYYIYILFYIPSHSRWIQCRKKCHRSCVVVLCKSESPCTGNCDLHFAIWCAHHIHSDEIYTLCVALQSVSVINVNMHSHCNVND